MQLKIYPTTILPIYLYKVKIYKLLKKRIFLIQFLEYKRNKTPLIAYKQCKIVEKMVTKASACYNFTFFA